jgi:putative Mn2+ efflux pump MntP
MDLSLVFVVAFTLALDCFAVSLAAGTTIATGKFTAAVIIGMVFALFQAGMAFIGWLSGIVLSTLIFSFAPWAAFFILAIIGIHMIREGLENDKGEVRDYLSPLVLLLLAVATSLDSLGVGLSFALLSNPILIPAVVIGLMSGLLSFTGVMIGSRVAKRYGRHIEVGGGAILILIGIRLLLGHMV